MSWLRTAITDADLDQDVLRRLLGILDKNVEVAIAIKDTCIQQLIFHVATIAPLARLDQIVVGKRGLRILVQVLHVGVRGRAVEVEVILFDILAVIALAVGQPKQALLQYRILVVPQTYAEAQQLVPIADAGQAILAPVIGAGAGLVMAKVVPGISVLAVVLANRPPLPLAKVGSPLSPGFLAGGFVLESEGLKRVCLLESF